MIRILTALSLAVLVAPAQALDLERIEAIGVVPMRAGVELRTPPRDQAVRQALLEAVRKSAVAILPFVDAPTLGHLTESLGNDPFEFAARFQIVEDRGEQPALFSADENAQTEYVVVVDVHVDRDRIRERLAGSGLLEPPSGSGTALRTRIALEGLDDYRSYEQIRSALLVGVGVRSATPIEASQGRVVLEVDSDRNANSLLMALRNAAPPTMMLVAEQIDPDLLRLRIVGGAPSDPGVPPRARSSNTHPLGEIDPIDTPERNRY